jgi:putative ubiquitin-RnfH superfamily antitoxin RatB of RatAB toxin-antitoxin module
MVPLHSFARTIVRVKTRPIEIYPNLLHDGREAQQKRARQVPVRKSLETQIYIPY